MITDVLRQVVLPKLDSVRPSGAGYSARCPMPDHEDSTASLMVSTGRNQPVVMYCHGCQARGNDIAEAAGIPWDAISQPSPERPADDTWMPCGHPKVAEYEYRDQHDTLVFAVARCSEKGKTCQGFRQWRPDPDSKSGKRWSRRLPGGGKVGEGLPFRLPQLLAADPALGRWIVEGEKDALALWGLGIPGTCNAEGAGKWTDAHAAWFTDSAVVIVADRDPAGWRHAEHVTNTLMGHAREIEIVRAAAGKDLCDHLAAGYGLDDLVQVAFPKRRSLEVAA